jgi:hypothetical protein
MEKSDGRKLKLNTGTQDVDINPCRLNSRFLAFIDRHYLINIIDDSVWES